MSDEQDSDALSSIIPDPVREVYAEEEQFIAQKIKYAREQGEAWFRKLTEFIPYIDELMTEHEIGPAAATSDVNREVRKQNAIAKIEAKLGVLDDETKANISRDIDEMYNGTNTDE